jgi:hypothetical protein
MGINFSGNIYNSRDTENSYSTQSVENNRKAASVEFSCNYIRYPYSSSNLFLYYGFGPSFSTSYTYSEDNYFADSILSSNLNKYKTYGVGIKGLLGIEWFFHKHFSLLTEYNLSSYYTRQYVYSKSSTEDHKHILNEFSLQSSSVVFGISIYL